MQIYALSKTLNHFCRPVYRAFLQASVMGNTNKKRLQTVFAIVI